MWIQASNLNCLRLSVLRQQVAMWHTEADRRTNEEHCLVSLTPIFNFAETALRFFLHFLGHCSKISYVWQKCSTDGRPCLILPVRWRQHVTSDHSQRSYCLDSQILRKYSSEYYCVAKSEIKLLTATKFVVRWKRNIGTTEHNNNNDNNIELQNQNINVATWLWRFYYYRSRVYRGLRIKKS